MNGADMIGALLVVFACVTDVRKRIIPNYLTVTAVVGALLFHSIMTGIDGLLFVFKGIMIGFIPLFLLYVMRTVGAGDVKFFAALGAWMGGGFIWDTFMLSIIYGGLIALAILLYQYRTLGKRLLRSLLLFIGLQSLEPIKDVIRQPATFPFMIAVAPAAVSVYSFSLYAV
ncbi:A24 family peptidase [Paenibacillus assamensis]|uniref:A24 family peptidase n=1 Tax=Paenibacillus assamensis TaxID=311244 RepID=UPI00040C6363|nr:prepilin peptidase [Paenibacillus assamensis]